MPKCECSAPRRRLNPLWKDRIVSVSLLMIFGGALILILLFGAGCQSHTRVTPASSEAVRTSSIRNGSVEWEVVVTPKENGK